MSNNYGLCCLVVSKKVNILVTLIQVDSKNKSEHIFLHILCVSESGCPVRTGTPKSVAAMLQDGQVPLPERLPFAGREGNVDTDLDNLFLIEFCGVLRKVQRS